MEKRVKINDACLSVLKFLKHTSFSIRNSEFWKCYYFSSKPLPIFSSTSSPQGLCTWGHCAISPVYLTVLCAMSIPRAGRSSQIESVTIRKCRKTVHVNDRTQKSFKTAFLPIGRHPAFVSNYDLSKISNFLNKIFLFFLKKKALHNFPRVGNTQSPSFYSPNQLHYFSRSWNFSKMANTQNKSDQQINPSLFHHQSQFLQH